VFHVKDYEYIVGILVTPAEVVEYLDYRRQVLNTFPDSMTLPESALLGHFLYGETNTQPQIGSNGYVEILVQEANSFDLAPVLRQFAEKIVPQGLGEISDDQATDYYAIIKEFARLKRNELKVAKERIDLALKWCTNDEYHLPTPLCPREQVVGLSLPWYPVNFDPFWQEVFRITPKLINTTRSYPNALAWRCRKTVSFETLAGVTSKMHGQ